ncbi:hypothetical protein LCGC14_2451780 [marine sediment metagenome]|uniref:Uncharacterized protein n=1 Tax=marine sediment metagenome TaxID=412755 RepID=A0A0F9C3G6_9ZZZZ
MMKCWLSEWLDFLFPEPVEVDMDGEPEKPATDALPEIPPMFRAEPLVQEAERVVRGTPLTVKNIKDALRRSRR